MKNNAYKLAGIILIIFISVLTLILLIPVEYLMNFAHDDSFFYLKTAFNYVSGYGSTFDKLNITNGYHLLWFLVLVVIYSPLYLLFGETVSPETIFKYTFGVEVIIILVNIIFLRKIWNTIDENKNNYSFIILILMLFSFVYIRDIGMESHLNCLLISIYLYIIVCENKPKNHKYIFKIFTVSLIFFGRFDYILSIIPLMILADIFSSHQNIIKRKKLIISYIIILTSSIVIYLGANYFLSGHIISISSHISNSFPNLLFADNLKVLIYTNFKFYNQFIRIIIIVFTFISLSYILLRDKKKKKDKIYYMLYFLNIGSIIYILINISFNRLNIREWYLTLPMFISILSLTLFLREFISKLSVILVVLIFLIISFYQTRIINQKYSNYYKYSKELERYTNANDFIFQIDATGLIGFFSNRNIVNGDGLINSYEYYDYLKSGNISSYLRKYRINLYSSYSTYNFIDSVEYRDDWLKSISPNENILLNEKDLILKFPYHWEHSIFETKGEWYLFKINL